MTDVVFTEDQWNIIKDALDEAYTTRNYFLWLSNTSMRITRDHIALPKLRHALEVLNAVDIENPRRLEAVTNAPVNRRRTSTAKK